ncbi:LysE family translocator [Tepidibacter hydrothermalis]|uniref:LysE family transporter n=1 Tax=Tepidibacter hydrothermalis TaxID=3036126 RepID=A0ABY8EJD8_9FIRM|nr:LysE family transporter [Tepidibacter hydrothermalis]WFD11892.1 LysE family transporter [Tepidibacter hydrothermalis]
MILKGFRFGMILQIAVGPVCLFIFHTAVTSGFFTALIGVLGIAIIDAIYILAAIFGIGIIICKHEKMKDIIKYFGASVLIMFGISTILEFFGFYLIPNLNFLSKQSMESVFLKTIVLTLSNPLTILFWVGVFSTKVSEENMNQKDMYYFGLGAVISTMTFLTIISIMGSFINNFLDSIIINALNFIVGLVLIAFGIKTAVKS